MLRHSVFYFAILLFISAGSLPAAVTLSDKEFFDAMDLSRPGLVAVKTAVKAGDYPAARIELIKYFDGRKAPISRYEISIGKNPDFDTAIADKVCEHIFTRSEGSFYLGERVDWSARVSYKNGRPIGEFATGINRHGGGSVGCVVNAYENTGNEKYAETAIDLLMTWIEDVPFPEPVFATSCHYSWKSLATGLRLSGWTDFWFVLRHSPAFTPDRQIAMLKAVLIHARFLATDACLAGGNWMFMINNGLGAASVLFPEFKESKDWQNIAFNRIADAYNEQIYPDGLQEELSPHYHWVSVVSTRRLMETLDRNGIPHPSSVSAVQEKMANAVMRLSDPLGFQPCINDCDRINMRPTLLSFAKQCDRPDMEFVGSGFSSGTEPKAGSFGFPYAGFYVTRSGWNENAHWAVFDAGPFGRHSHEDKLGMELFAFGRKLLFDSTNNKNSYEHTAYRWYQIKTTAHNTVMVDGQEQCRNRFKEKAVISAPLDNRWVSTPGFDYVRGRYNDGYRDVHRVENPRSVDAVHNRELVFVKPGYWLVRDTVDGSGFHTVETMWHIMPTELIFDPQTGSTRTSNEDSNLLIVPGNPDDVAVRNVEGFKERRTDIPMDIPDGEFGVYTMQGWGVFGQKTEEIPTPTAIYKTETSLPYGGEFLLIPYSGSTPIQVGMKRLPVQTEAGQVVPADQAVGLAVSRPEGTDFFCFNNLPGQSLQFGDILADGRFAQIRQDSYGLIDGRTLKQAGKVFLQSSDDIDSINVQLSTNAVEISLSNPESIREVNLHASGAASVRINGIDVAYERTEDQVIVFPNEPDRYQAVADSKPEKVIMASYKDGRGFREITTRSGLYLTTSADPVGNGQAKEITAVFYNQSLPTGTEITLKATAPPTPGKKGSVEWQFDNPVITCSAPPAGTWSTHTFSVRPVLKDLSDFDKTRTDGIQVTATAVCNGRKLSALTAHTAVEMSQKLNVIDQLVFDETNTEQLNKHDVQANVRSKNGSFGGPAGNRVSWTCKIPKTGQYVLSGMFVAGGDRKCRLSYTVKRDTVRLPAVTAEKSSLMDQAYIVDLPKGPVDFMWEATGGWSYIKSFKIIKTGNE